MSATSGTTEDAADRAGRDLSGLPTWALFCDWCVATAHLALPATASTLARFLVAHPAAASTQRRRVADIDTAHRRRGLAEPGKTVTIRLAVNERRREQADRVRAAAASIIGQVPANGWPGGLFGRRDAMILTLLASGMTPTEITVLRRGDIIVDSSDLVVSEDHRITSNLFGDRPGHEPVAIYRRWAQIQAILDGAATTRMVADALDPNRASAAIACPPPDVVPTARASEPLLVRIDRWGHTPWAPDPLTRTSASVLARAHLTRQPPTHRDRIATPGHSGDTTATPAVQDDVVLGGSYYAYGIAARRRAHERLSDLGSRLDEIDERIEALLCRLDDITDGASVLSAGMGSSESGPGAQWQ
ncbi:hypothetical protein CH262_02910 [Rhodococcus sp. 05-2255-1e]|uniref:hypothetical protein n=1 Tax=Rhodococcus sp. 05-2255-1e TaxID=2022495 RepID=UPI000B9A4047|nr:hypothetical protein [Rhodococcus sp. 05-2255-1e]OZE28287.1 hypothetical protein CH262_02910 [Rhodococcus sp. 05-2255-1e]